MANQTARLKKALKNASIAYGAFVCVPAALMYGASRLALALAPLPLAAIAWIAISRQMTPAEADKDKKN